MEPVFSPLWYRVAGLHARLRSHVRVHRHCYRDQIWFVLQDQASGRHHRVNEAGYQFVGRLDGSRTVQEVWDSVVALRGENALTQGEAIQILSQLNDSDLLQCEMTPDVAQLFRRRDERARKRRLGAINPLAFKVPLFDPSALLNRLVTFTRPLLHPALWFVWAGIVLFGLFSAFSNWDPIRLHAAQYLLTPRYLLLMWLCYPVIKALHETAHALAVRIWGGEVHEMGLTLLLLVPVPYVDASAASAFREKHQRVTVGALGVMVELLVAALATLVWLNVQDGWLRDIAFIAMFIGSVSTLLFNGNPLLKFDAYYVLSDAVDLPNLGQRSNAYLAYLAQRYLLGAQPPASPAATLGERAWFLGYGLSSWLYRLLVSTLVIFWIATKSVLLATALAGWFLVSMLLKPALAGLQFLWSSPRLAARRVRACAVLAGCLAAIITLVWIVPMPLATEVEGVVWLPEQAQVRAGTDGFAEQFLARDGERVKPGQPLLALSDPTLIAEQKKLQAQLVGLDVQQQAALRNNSVKAQSVAEEMARIQAELNEIESRLAKLIVTSPSEGVLAMPHQQDTVGAFFNKGATLGHVLNPGNTHVRVAVPHEDVALVRERTRTVAVRLAEAPELRLAASVIAEVPAATTELPSAALGDKAGGALTTDPADAQGLHTLQPIFLFDLNVLNKSLERVGGRVHVRFDHGREVLAARLQRAFKRVLLAHFEAKE